MLLLPPFAVPRRLMSIVSGSRCRGPAKIRCSKQASLMAARL